jgi:hypothetical protein
MKSFSLLRTNVGLSTNMKIIVDGKYNLFVDTIESTAELTYSHYKKKSFNKNNYFDDLIPYLFKETPIETAFFIKNDNVDSMSNDFSFQYDELYQMGARNIINNKNYEEEYEYFAPLYLVKDKLPEAFIIFRVDGPGIIELNKDNFNIEILQKLKTVKLFEMSEKTQLGEWLNFNFKNNDFMPNSPIDLDFRNLEFSKWNGIDYETGGYTSKSLFMDEILEKENEIFELERFVLDGFKRNKVVFPNILNLSFLFDDEPATPELLRKWSLNRYYGFYIDKIEEVSSIVPYMLPLLKSDVRIEEGNLLSSEQEMIDNSPFIGGWIDDNEYYVEYKGNFYKVEKFEEDSPKSLMAVNKAENNRILKNRIISDEFSTTKIIKYRIISDIDLLGKGSELNKNIAFIDDENKIRKFDTVPYVIDNFDSADIWIIEIDNIYHNIIRSGNTLMLNTDYAFSFKDDSFTYWINKKDINYTKNINLKIDIENNPKKFTIFKLRLSDIKDFDTRIVDTEYSKYEYEKEDELTITDETKMYMENLRSKSKPRDITDYIYKNNVVNIPVSSEYTANYETFKVNDGKLSEIWNVNPIYCRWVFKNSISANDYPYLLNNSELFEDFNRTVNPFDPDPKRIERNLDYFYTINSSTHSYIHHSLHIEDHLTDGTINTNFKFELNKYINGTFSNNQDNFDFYKNDYFSEFFDRKTFFNSGKIIKNVKKYSIFNKGDNSVPNLTVFKGIKFFIYNVKDIKIDTNRKIESFNLSTENTFEDYKFSILLSDNDQYLDVQDNQIKNLDNKMEWYIISNWENDKIYKEGDIVIYDDILYIALQENITILPETKIGNIFVKSFPGNITNGNVEVWGILNHQTILWNPELNYNVGNIVYNSGEYYIFIDNAFNTIDFWNPKRIKTNFYITSDIVLFRGFYYISNFDNNIAIPGNGERFFKNGKNIEYWTLIPPPIQIRWKVIELWDSSKIYQSNNYIVYNKALYKSKVNIKNDTDPNISEEWELIYDINPNTNTVYSILGNRIPLIEMNNKYYLFKSNNNSTLNNGINIYINKIWKNVLINININDNTIPNISSSDRDILYSDLNKKLTAYNFINSINDLSNKYGFTDYLNYFIIENGENDEVKISNYNYEKIEGIPYMIMCETPEEIKVKINSLSKEPYEIPNILKPKKQLVDGKIDDISMLNFYSNITLASIIKENKKIPVFTKNYSGMINNLYDIKYRFSGEYIPLFYDIELFNKKLNLGGNYKFDTSLTKFGEILERKIRKINRNGDILKLKENNSYRSIFPMVDEYYYTFVDFFIFKSTWDKYYFIETSIEEPKNIVIETLPDEINIGERNN